MDAIATNFIVTFKSCSGFGIDRGRHRPGPHFAVSDCSYSGALVPYNSPPAPATGRFGNIEFTGETYNGTPGIITQPTPQTATLPLGQLQGQPTVTFNASAYSTSLLPVQWQLSIDGGQSWNTAPGNSTSASFTPDVTSSSYMFTATSTSQTGYQFRRSRHRLAHNTNCWAQLTVVIPVAPSISTQPLNASSLNGNPVSFTASAIGLPASTVVWQVSTDGGDNWNTAYSAPSPPRTSPRPAEINSRPPLSHSRLPWRRMEISIAPSSPMWSAARRPTPRR